MSGSESQIMFPGNLSVIKFDRLVGGRDFSIEQWFCQLTDITDFTQNYTERLVEAGIHDLSLCFN